MNNSWDDSPGIECFPTPDIDTKQQGVAIR